MHTCIINTRKEFHQLRSAWNQLNPHEIMQDFDWHYIWWQTYQTHDMQLAIIVCFDQNHLVGIAPFYVKKISSCRFIQKDLKILYFLGCGEESYEEVVSEYLDILCMAAHKKRVAQWVANAMTQQLGIDSMRLTDVLGESSVVKYLVHQLSLRGWRINMTPDGWQYKLILPDSYQHYLAQRKAKFRTKLNNRPKRLATLGPIEYHQVYTQEQLDALYPKLIALHFSQWQIKQQKGAFVSAKFIHFHRQLAHKWLNEGKYQLHYMTLNHEVIAVYYYLIHEKKIYYYQSGYDTRYSAYAVANIMLGYAINWSIGQGMHEFDMMKAGDQSYKREYVNQRILMYNVNAFNRTLAGSFYYCWLNFKQKIQTLKRYWGERIRTIRRHQRV